MPSKKTILLVLLFFAASSLKAPFASAIGVQPMVFDFQGKPGGEYQFEILIFPESKQRNIHLSLYHPIQALDGSVSFEEGDANVNPAIGWVRFEKDRIAVPPGDPTIVKGTIKVPFDAGGSYSVIVMVAPVVGEAAEGITILVRYAIRLTMNIERAGLRSELKILDTELVADEEGKPLLKVHIQNPSAFRFPVAGESSIRDENRRLVERVQLRTLSAWESGHDSLAIYPNTELLLIAPITEPLYEGKFFVQNFLSYDATKQAIGSKEIFVEKGQFANLWEHLISLEPGHLEATLRPGAAATHILQLENRQNEELKLQIIGEDITADYSHSVFQELGVEFRGDQELTLKPRENARNILILKSTRETAPGGYYGNLKIHVFSTEQELLESHTIPINVLVSGELKRSAQVQSLVVEAADEEYLFSAVIKNVGNVHLLPRATVELRGENNDLTNIVRLETPKEGELLLPDMDGFLIGTLAEDNIKPGHYNATVQVFEGDAQIGSGDFTIVIEEKTKE